MHPTKQITLLERISFLSIFFQLPFRALAAAFLSPFLKQWKKKRLNRVRVEAAVKYYVGRASIRQLQWATGTSVDVYRGWAKANRVQPVIEDVGENAKLLWLTEKRTDRVLFYVHGGAYMLTATDTMLAFCPRVHQELLKRDNSKDFGIVALAYSLHPAKFPTQLDEISQALTYLLSSGVKPENLILIGDSAGANVIVQLLVHTLHPFEGVTPSPLQRVTRGLLYPSEVTPPKRLGGVCLLSPWQSIDTPTPSYERNEVYDVLPATAVLNWGKVYLEGVPDSHLPWIKTIYCEPDLKEPWFAGLDEYLERILITAGGKEVLLDDATGLYSALKNLPNSKLDVRLDVEENGVHEDPIFDTSFPQKPRGGLGDATMNIVNWVEEVFGF
ncbi:hypothetical protein GYMLUDRAFT_97084 [Collybiopsis luxurians FD-317 M1]|uniref:Alpha/beta hydrolase fold-3 domain-containing protein n=1 Tax=Collybiopsis luxurians FD-317 M1 TaxID=944289 RepID=A0A0D0BXA1_9AGAR|nr:hypothetical protein GYMLUDRAFT_97084 [Collybiopsis luxurians FD-317 M1]